MVVFISADISWNCCCGICFYGFNGSHFEKPMFTANRQWILTFEFDLFLSFWIYWLLFIFSSPLFCWRWFSRCNLELEFSELWSRIKQNLPGMAFLTIHSKAMMAIKRYGISCRKRLISNNEKIFKLSNSNRFHYSWNVVV